MSISIAFIIHVPFDDGASAGIGSSPVSPRKADSLGKGDNRAWRCFQNVSKVYSTSYSIRYIGVQANANPMLFLASSLHQPELLSGDLAMVVANPEVPPRP